MAVEEFSCLTGEGVSEQVWCGVRVCGDSVLVGCIYRPPGSGKEVTGEIIRVLLRARARVERGEYRSMVVFGDFNFPGVTWSSGSGSGANQDEAYFLQGIEESFLAQCVDFPTYKRVCMKEDSGEKTVRVKESLLDLILTSEQERMLEISRAPPLGDSESGHYVLNWKFAISESKDSINQRRSKMVYRRADFGKISHEFDNIDWEMALSGLGVEACYVKFLEIFNEACSKYVPKSRASDRKRGEPWIDSTIRDAIKSKHRLWYRTVKKEDKGEYVRSCKELKKLIRRAKYGYENMIAMRSKKKPKRVHAYVRSKLVVKDQLRALKDISGELVTGRKEIAGILSEQFSSVFVKEPEAELSFFSSRTGMSFGIGDILSVISVSSVKDRLSKLSVDKSVGVDGVHPIILKNCADAISRPLKVIFEKSLVEGKIPELWRLANVTPIFKKGNRSEAQNYRPVSLTSVVCKVLEGFVRDSLMEYLARNGLLAKEQHGFVRNKSCVTNLLESLDFITHALANGKCVDEILLDFAKAFDTVPHKRLVHKMMRGY